MDTKKNKFYLTFSIVYYHEQRMRITVSTEAFEKNITDEIINRCRGYVKEHILMLYGYDEDHLSIVLLNASD